MDEETRLEILKEHEDHNSKANLERNPDVSEAIREKDGNPTTIREERDPKITPKRMKRTPAIRRRLA